MTVTISLSWQAWVHRKPRLRGGLIQDFSNSAQRGAQARLRHATAKRGITHKIKRGWQSFIMVANSAGDCREYKARRLLLGHQRRWKAAQRMEWEQEERSDLRLNAAFRMKERTT